MYGEPVLKCPDFNRAFVLESDASDRGVGAVLSQMYDGEDHPVAYFSKKLLPREMFSVVEKECLAIRLAVQMFRCTWWEGCSQYRRTTGHLSG